MLKSHLFVLYGCYSFTENVEALGLSCKTFKKLAIGRNVQLHCMPIVLIAYFVCIQTGIYTYFSYNLAVKHYFRGVRGVHPIGVMKQKSS